MTERHAVVGLLLVVFLALPCPAASQSVDEWRTRFAAGEQARQAGEHRVYATEMAAAADALPEDVLNRPFIQYHAARAAALAGDADAAVYWLRTTWDEGLESLMISFAPFDPAFADIVDDSDFLAVMALAAEIELSVRRLGGSVHLIVGAGANVVAQVGSDGVFLVDTGYGSALPALQAALASLSNMPVSRLLVTHPHEDHMGATPELGAAVTVLAHPGTTAAMRAQYDFMDGVSMPPKPQQALPDVEISGDTTFVFNGETVRVVPTLAHTGGDLSVYFSDAHVAHFGDSYLPGNPMIYPGTEDPDGFLDRLEAFIGSMDLATVVVGGHEEIGDLAAVRAQIEVSRACMAFVRGAMEDGLTIEQTAEQGVDRFPPQWVAFFYGLFASR